MHTVSPCPKSTGQLTRRSRGRQAGSHGCSDPLTNVQVSFYIMAFKATFVNATDPWCNYYYPFGGIWVLYRNKQIKKKKETKKYIHILYINLKTLYKWVVIYKMLMLRGGTLYSFKKKKRKTYLKRDGHRYDKQPLKQ